MTAIQVIENPALEGKRRALVLAEDRVGHYPEFREFFVKQFSLGTNALSRPGYARTPAGSRLVVDASEGAVKSGQTHPADLKRFQKRGVVINS
jgi:hypothetical protein